LGNVYNNGGELMRRKIAILLVSLLASLGLAAGTSSAALAAIPSGYSMDLATGKVSKPTQADLDALRAISCTSGYICFVENNPPSGAAYPVPQSWTGCGTFANIYMNNRTSYIFNSTGYTWYVWDSNSVCDSSARGTIYPHTAAGMNGTWNDKITNYKRG
jgi:hypothetical protein